MLVSRGTESANEVALPRTQGLRSVSVSSLENNSRYVPVASLSMTREGGLAIPMARVLVIEDNELVRAVLQLKLREAGHDVRSAADGPSGIASVKDAWPDVVVLDLSMPGMDGREVLQQLRSTCPGVPVFLFTVYGDMCHRVGGLDVEGCFVKSADLTPLIAAVGRVSSRRNRCMPNHEIPPFPKAPGSCQQ